VVVDAALISDPNGRSRGTAIQRPGCAQPIDAFDGGALRSRFIKPAGHCGFRNVRACDAIAPTPIRLSKADAGMMLVMLVAALRLQSSAH
jgi:hypothetical protein